VPGPPLISVIIPVFNVEDDLPACLESVLGQPGPAIEVIAVDNGSTDRSGQILDDCQARDPRVRALHTPQQGPGAARNTGLDQAAGEYVWFVDADDLIPPGTLAAVAGALGQQRPDVLLIGFERLYPGGETQPSLGDSVLRGLPPEPVTLAERPALINHTMTAWGKLFRRAFLTGLPVGFPPGIHEDVPVSCAALLAARRISGLDRVCYQYRQGRRGSVMIRTSKDHFDVFRSYRQVLEQAEKRQADGDPLVTPEVRQALFERAIWHYAAIFGTGGWGIGPLGRSGLVPRGRRREFFAMMHADFGAFRPPGYVLPPGARGAKLRLIERGAYGTYSLLEPANRLRVRLKR
jgi:CDP-glycerol glycerophosphotransferase